jgi:hypothetical protein
MSKEVLVTSAGKVISSAYPNGSYPDADVFVKQVAVVLDSYSELVIRAASDPNNSMSVQRTHPKFPPTVGQIADVCVAIAQYQERVRLEATKPKASLNRPYREPKNYPGCRANVMIPYDAPQYARVKEFVDGGRVAEQDFEAVTGGIRIALSVFQNLNGG